MSPTPRQRWSAHAALAVLLVAFGVIAPFGTMPLPRVDAFIPSIEGIFFVNDLITAALLFSQFSIIRSRALLVLANGYFFTALIVIPHLLTYPGVFSPTGLLGAGLQTTIWLYIFWHYGFAVSVIAYAWLDDADRPNKMTQEYMRSAIGWSVAGVTSLVCGLTWLSIAQEQSLPRLFQDTTHAVPYVTYFLAVNVLASSLALALLWARRRSVLDEWLVVVAFAFTLEMVIAAWFTVARFTVGFYADRIFSLVPAVVVLIVLLAESTRLYVRLARSHLMLARERNNKLMNAEATAAAIAHELKQPLAAMVANADASLGFLEQMPPNILSAKEALDDIVADGHRTSEALDGVRALFRNVNEGREPVDLNEICREVLHSMRGELSDHGITLQSEFAPQIPLVWGNRGQLQQVMFNLAHNAVEAMVTTRDRSRVLRLITQRGDQDRIIVAIQDTGPGIDPKRLDDIFDAFVTTKPQGTGLGLAICRIIIERHGGQLTAFSDGKSGALFQIALPVGVN